MPLTPDGRELDGGASLYPSDLLSAHQEPCLLHPLPQPQPWKGELPQLPAPEPAAALPLPPPRALSCFPHSFKLLDSSARCSVPRPQLPGLFNVGHVAEQLRQAGILEAVRTRSANFPVRVPFQAFLAR